MSSEMKMTALIIPLRTPNSRFDAFLLNLSDCGLPLSGVGSVSSILFFDGDGEMFVVGIKVPGVGTVGVGGMVDSGGTGATGDKVVDGGKNGSSKGRSDGSGVSFVSGKNESSKGRSDGSGVNFVSEKNGSSKGRSDGSDGSIVYLSIRSGKTGDKVLDADKVPGGSSDGEDKGGFIVGDGTA